MEWSLIDLYLSFADRSCLLRARKFQIRWRIGSFSYYVSSCLSCGLTLSFETSNQYVLSHALKSFNLNVSEDEPAPLVIKKDPKSAWDDEDVDENDIKESWEDDDEPAPPPVVAPVVKAPKKSTVKPAQEKKKEVEVTKEEPLDPVAEKLRQQRLVEEADYKNTAELFASKKDDDNKTIDNFIPKSESDFIEYAELISSKLRPFEKSYHYLGLLKNVMRLSMTSLKAADSKEVASSVTANANEKLKAEKEAAAGKKKTGGKKKQIHLDKPDDDAVVNAGYDGYDDYDFM
ncbi:uncharacterized protein [Rutidosis leptorrhynchoides]|uniref:uncharacterized protein n=1 Tax=Rutidosis leptorrhynchoides TaxID=125765 RepID=UPI003A98DC98